MKYFYLLLIMSITTFSYAQDEEAGAKLFKKVDPSVVAIQIEQAGGSGMIISEDGYIITNGHVIADLTSANPLRTSQNITVILHNDKKFKATVIGHSMDPDIALLKINAGEPLTPVTFSDSGKVRTGQKSYALGMPTGHKRTLTSGIISNTERYIGTFTTVFQTDAAINPGNSGGPLFNENGEVIGVNTYAGRGQNQGFTLPAKVALTLKDHFINYGYFKRAVVPFFFTQYVYEELGQKIGVDSGVLVEFVEENSPAYLAGMRTGDVIIEKNGKAVNVKKLSDLIDFEWEMSVQEVGSNLDLVLLRNENGKQIKVPFSAKMIEDEPQPRSRGQAGEIKDLAYTELGLSVTPIVTVAKYMFDLENNEGVIVSKANTNSVAFKAGLKQNSRNADVITEVDDKPSKNINDFIQHLETALTQNKEYIPLKVSRSKITFKTALKPDYLLKDKKIGIVFPNDPEIKHLDLVRRYFISNGASVVFYDDAIKTYQHQPKQRGDLPFKIEVNKTIESLAKDQVDVILIAPTSNHENLVSFKLPNEVLNSSAVIAGFDNSPVIIFNLFEKAKERKITADKDHSADLISKNANFTGKEVETDGQIITSTGLNEDVVEKFLEKIKEKLLEQDD